MTQEQNKTTERPVKQEGFAWISPTMVTRDAERALSFYEKALGFTIEKNLQNAQGKTLFAQMSYKGMTFMLEPKEFLDADSLKESPVESGHFPPIGFYIYCEDLEETYKRALEHGAKSYLKPEDAFWGDRIAKIIDPDGYLWGLAKHTHDFDPSKMPPSWQ